MNSIYYLSLFHFPRRVGPALFFCFFYGLVLVHIYIKPVVGRRFGSEIGGNYMYSICLGVTTNGCYINSKCCPKQLPIE